MHRRVLSLPAASSRAIPGRGADLSLAPGASAVMPNPPNNVIVK